MPTLQMTIDDPNLPFNWWQNRASMLWRRRVYFSQFAAAAVTGGFNITTFPAGVEIMGAYLWLVVNFTGGGAAAVTMNVGTTGTPTLYVNAQNVFAGARIIRVGAAQVPGTFLNAAAPDTAGTVRIEITADVNTNLLTAGQADVFLRLAAVKLRR